MLMAFLAFVMAHIYWDWIIDNSHWFLLFALFAGIADAVKDTLAHHFSTSVFNKLNPKFWNPEVSWKYKIKSIGMSLDAWHLFKMAHTLFICLAVVFFMPIENLVISYVLVYLFYKTGFNLFYSKLLIK